MLLLSPQTTDSVAMHAGERSWIMFVQLALPLSTGPIRIEGASGNELAMRLHEIDDEMPWNVFLVGLIPTENVDSDVEVVRNQFYPLKGNWFSPTSDLLEYIAKYAWASLIELTASTHPGAMEEGHLVNIEEMAGILKVSVPTVRRMVKLNQIPFLRVGRALRFAPIDVVQSVRANGAL